MTDCETCYEGVHCTRPAVWRYHALSTRPHLLCHECAERMVTKAGTPSLEAAMRGRLVRLETGP